jgi:hypothetical protein
MKPKEIIFKSCKGCKYEKDVSQFKLCNTCGRHFQNYTPTTNYLKVIIVAFPQMILILIGLPFWGIDTLQKNIICRDVLIQLNKAFFFLEEWSDNE